MQLTRAISLWGPVVGWAGLIFALSSIPRLTTGWGAWDFFLRKGAHMTEYGILAVFLARAIQQTWTFSLRRFLLLALLGSVLYAVSDEIHQHFVPGRSCSAIDVLIDGTGALLAILWYRRRIL